MSPKWHRPTVSVCLGALWCDKVPPTVTSEYCREQRHSKSWIFNATPGNGCYFLWCSESSTSTALDWQFPAVQGLFIKLDARDHFSEWLERLDKMLQRHRVANGRLWQKGADQTFLWHSDYPRTKALCQIWLCLPKYLELMFPFALLVQRFWSLIFCAL